MAERPRILLVEDEPVIAFALEDLVIELGYEPVGPAYRLQGALDLAGREIVDAAILDVNLDGKLSYPVADLLREKKVPILFATGYAEGGVEWTGEAMIIAKPYSREQLAQALSRLLLRTG